MRLPLRRPRVDDHALSTASEPRTWALPAPLVISYLIRARNLATGAQAECPATTERYTDEWRAQRSRFEKAVEAMGKTTGTLRLEVIEQVEGGQMPEGARVVHTRDLTTDDERRYCGYRAREFVEMTEYASIFGVSLAERPLRRELLREIDDEGATTLRLMEYRIEHMELDPAVYMESGEHLLSIPVVLAEAVIEADDLDATAAMAEFVADAQRQISGYERERRGIGEVNRDLAAERKRHAQLLADVMDRVQAEIAAEDAAEMRALSA